MNFKEFLDSNNVEYHFYGSHNVLSINYDGNDNQKEISQEIKSLDKTAKL